MVDLSANFVGIKSPNPFWLASAPPTDCKINVERAFRAGWGGVVWKTLGEAGPPAVNVSGPRYGALYGPDRRVFALNSIETIADRDLAVNLQEIKQVKCAWPDRAVAVSLMVPSEEASLREILARVEETGCDGVELNFSCQPGVFELGETPETIETATRWCKAHTRMPVIVKLTPSVVDIRDPARAAQRGGADAVSLINAIPSIMGVDLDAMTPVDPIDGKGAYGGMCGPAVKPIALAMVAKIARDPMTAGLPISGIGGVTIWRDAAEFIALGAGNVQVCAAAMTYGFKIIDELTSGLKNFMAAKGYQRIDDFRGRAVENVTDWRFLNLSYVAKAEIDQSLCIKCGRCHIVCEDTARQAIFATADGERKFVVNDARCIGCNLCALVCPVENCIKLAHRAEGVDPRTGSSYAQRPRMWTAHRNNPATKAAE
jgi:dihydropyrimidine dehydrogenase (NAD+) subunit PreA